jgi:hypothetical protein
LKWCCEAQGEAEARGVAEDEGVPWGEELGIMAHHLKRVKILDYGEDWLDASTGILSSAGGSLAW